ncbi:MAG TPA: YihY/virulence factor BrkB family protein [Candidatus Dormibacteraeota bacterium]
MIRKVQGWLPVRVLQAFGASQAANYASALAFNALLSMFPLILGILAVIGLSIRDPATQEKVQSLIIATFPSTAQAELLHALQGVKQSAGWLGLISIGGLIWSGSGVFATMEFAFAEIFGIPQRDTVRQKLMGFVMMIVLVAAVATSVGANAAAALLPGAWFLSIVVGALVMVTLLVLLYRLVPNRSFKFREVLPGALLAGVLIEALSLAWPVYTRFAGGFNTYGAQFALFLLLATWFYLLSNLILLGAVFNKFRTGEPERLGLIASPMHESREVERAHTVIEKKKAEVPPAPPREPRPPATRRVAGYAVLCLALLASLFRRIGRRTAKA